MGGTVQSLGKMAKFSSGSVESNINTVTDEQLARHGLGIDPSDGYIRWLKDSKDHPRNWTVLRKTNDTSLVMLLEFYTCVFAKRNRRLG
jgi:hypothetical protein